DEYAAAFAPPTYSPHFIPVLSHNDTVNLPALCTLLWNRSNDFCGLIATSARAIHPLTKAFPIPPSATDVVRRGAEHLKAKWRAKPFYCVGKATAAAAAAAGFQPAGWDTGTAATLAGLIVDAGCHKPTPYWLAHWEKANGNMHLPETYLFLGGDKASDVLPKRLEEGGVKYEQLTVYETTPSPTFHADLASLPASPTPQHKRPWVVFFSPSGVDIALRAIRTHPGWKHARLASIGPTTSERIAELGEVVDVEAPTPGVEGVWEGIR
ncbi:tetrapyrrole biosynthesis, uroporphyrinogen III synthase, partial [Fimicolochytrium jonesii]|uniref:tetrapyrrole biosynthesis, uroporphyrinogen III synthase n=1 Tax=Fimicolochytrium jonesii TaxID=1396493 RepID=UPI0022FEB823